jgi:hypothetical protein
LGLRPFGIFPDLAVIELRGGTHILLFSKNDELPSSLSSSHLGQRGGASFNERLDLMIDGKSRSDLELYRATLMEKGLSVDAIAQDQFFGHDYFQLVDPDGNCAFRRRRPRCPAHGDHVIRSMTTRAAHELDGAVGCVF